MELLKRSDGFALAIMTALLPLLIGMTLLVFAVASFVQTDLEMKSICRSRGIAGQKQVAPLLERLLHLNPKAQQLHEEKLQAQAAAESGSTTAIAWLAEVEAQQEILEVEQQQLIQQSNLYLQANSTLGHKELSEKQAHIQNGLPLFSGSLTVATLAAPELAVRPDYPDIAPSYSPLPDFEDKQRLEQKWQYSFSIIKPLQRFLSGRFEFMKTCAVSLHQENFKWIPKMKKDRF